LKNFVPVLNTKNGFNFVPFNNMARTKKQTKKQRSGGGLIYLPAVKKCLKTNEQQSKPTNCKSQRTKPL
jgi:hypothetical protein